MTPETLAELHAQAFTTPPPWSAAAFAATLARPECFVLSEPGGFLLASVAAGEAEVLTLAVAPLARRQGIGRRLVAGFLAVAAARGAQVALLEVAADNRAALALYRGAGFAEVGRRHGYYRTPEGQAIDAVVMTRALPLPGI